jgi:hypothetical protein
MTPVLSILHVRQEGARHAEDAVERDVEHAAPLLVGHVDDIHLAAKTCIVDEHIDMAQRGDGRIAQGLSTCRLIGHIANMRGRAHSHFRRDPVRRFAQTAFVEIADENGAPSSAARLAAE